MRYLLSFLFCFTSIVFAQKDYSNQWQDLYSYNDVKDFTIVGNKLYSISNNAMFIYDLDTEEIHKFSSVNGLSGTTTSSISFDELSESIIIGYESGLVEIIDAENNVIPVTGIKDNLILVDKIVKGAYRSQNQLYLYGDFGIIELNIENFEFGDTYKLSTTSSSYFVNDIVVENNILYAATNNGLYNINLSSNPVDFMNWTMIANGNISNLLSLNDEVYFSKGVNVFEISNPQTSIITTSKNILDLSIDQSTSELIVTMSNLVELYEISTYSKADEIDLNEALDYSFTTTKAIINNDQVFVNTSDFGVLKTSLTDKKNYIELHPDGPSANDIFSITVTGNQKWVVYGGHNASYNQLEKTSNIDYFVNNKWNYLTYDQFSNTRDCVKAIVDPVDNTRVLVASVEEGIVELNNYKFKQKWLKSNSILPGNAFANETWIGNMIVDKNDIIWTANSQASNDYFFTSYNGRKEGADRWESNIDFTDKVRGKFIRGFNKMYVDQNNNVYAASARSGLFVFNANPIEDDTKRDITILNDLANNAQLPSNYVFSVVVDENERIWIGTGLGLVVFNDYDNLFSATKRPATTLIIEENGAPREFLADTQVNDIIIDLAGNKWFATQGAGVFQTSSDGQTTHNIFNISNSPLPSDNVIDLELDETTGEIYMVTEKGTLAYDSKNEPFGTSITSVIAYPNPAIRNQTGHEIITIVAKDGNGIPDGTNVKIMDVSGRLVYETNVNQSNQSFGGKVVWDKTNLRGNPVVSGVYIVLLSSQDGSETTTAKIAIVN
ncbi:type IX secretion system anionic LPS delivery protein PorZ [Wenyingzhuangia marina]|uniref:Por secretion system C-terminal sorting domain-containing protein n=1 Tax=Wenyingzhuangia marina TaxID=1195760 RepID=A0A1M5SVC3_9FLAO|nr:T9SS type A sorting domain-containing protein [Wenyingzhuangia marina]GGF64221.1 ABC transporter substrate-binding protein [Wenyingzhuangia marina]SHH42439.1 Por secretion system C-terminal sorting domain-containing protein [Wenyingzhuangia marina]